MTTAKYFFTVLRPEDEANLSAYFTEMTRQGVICSSEMIWLRVRDLKNTRFWPNNFVASWDQPGNIWQTVLIQSFKIYGGTLIVESLRREKMRQKKREKQIYRYTEWERERDGKKCVDR